MNVIDKFIPRLIEMEEEGMQMPIVDEQDATFIFVKHNNIYGGHALPRPLHNLG